MKKIFAALLCVISLSGCSSPEAPPAKFSNVAAPKIVLDVATVNIVDHGSFQPSDSPYKTYRLAPTIAEATHQWLAETLQAGGKSGQAIVVIQDASLTAKALAMSDSTLDTWFKRQQASQYTGHVDVQIDIRNGNSYALASAEATRSVSLPETPTENERQDLYVTLLNGLMKDFRQNLDASVREHMHNSILSMP